MKQEQNFIAPLAIHQRAGDGFAGHRAPAAVTAEHAVDQPIHSVINELGARSDIDEPDRDGRDVFGAYRTRANILGVFLRRESADQCLLLQVLGGYIIELLKPRCERGPNAQQSPFVGLQAFDRWRRRNHRGCVIELVKEPTGLRQSL